MPRRSTRKRKTRENYLDGQSDASDDEFVPNKDDSESEYEADNRPAGDSEPDLDPQERKTKPKEVPSADMNAKNDNGEPEAEQPLWKRKKRKKKIFVIDEEEEAKPTYTRKTEKGGYAHTNLSRSRISQANKGNKPWNFGRRRSSADRAKIAAGVRARNRSILLQKLKHLGMTEEEYLQKKKEIKYLRERIRRAKVANGKHLDKKIHQKLQAAIDATNLKDIKITDEGKEGGKKQEEEKKNGEAEENGEVKVELPDREDRIKDIFTKEIVWRPFSFSDQNVSYEESCPEGGLGGLICCDHCSTKYNMFLTRTSEDVETFRMKKESGEVNEILDILHHKKDLLKEGINAAKVKVPPLPPPGAKRVDLRPESVSGSRSSSTNRRVTFKPEIADTSSAWNLTSSVDLGTIGGFASV